MESIRISIIQTDIVWENKQENLRLLHEKLQSLRGITEIVVLPEMFSTGFSMQSKMLAEPNSGATITILKQWAAQFQLAICGSYIATENDQFYNRAFFLTPEGEEFYYDKRHLFRMGREAEHFSVGDKRLIIPYRGWNICLLVCYDLRFPVWSRNVNNEYDLLIYVANWPIPRRLVWDTLLRARALENEPGLHAGHEAEALQVPQVGRGGAVHPGGRPHRLRQFPGTHAPRRQLQGGPADGPLLQAPVRLPPQR